LIGGVEINQLTQNVAQKKKDDIEASKRHYTKEGAKLHSLGKYKEAIDCFDKALEKKPDDFVTLFYKGLAFYNLSKYDKALEWFDKAIMIKPDYAEAYYRKGQALVNLGKDQKAKRASPLRLYADRSFELSRIEEAIECYNKALDIHPNYFEALKDKGLALDRLGRYEEAIECYDRALKVIPNNELVLGYRQQAISKLKEIDKTEKERSDDTII
jgi:tetratricopeptide (TPR) repeat protein